MSPNRSSRLEAMTPAATDSTRVRGQPVSATASAIDRPLVRDVRREQADAGSVGLIERLARMTGARLLSWVVAQGWASRAEARSARLNRSLIGATEVVPWRKVGISGKSARSSKRRS